MAASTSVHVVECVPQKGCLQCLCSQVSSSYLLSVQEALEDQQLSLTQALFRLLLLPLVPEHVRFSKHPLRVEPPGTLRSKPCWPSEPNVAGVCLLSVRPPRVGV